MTRREAKQPALVQTKNSGDQKATMKSPRRRPIRFLVSAIVALAAFAMLPSLVSAQTITVDDDRAQCPLADETSLTTAVAAAANGDTVKVCAGTYTVPGGPAPSSGLRIEKNISIAGAGSDKVFVQPTQGTESMAQAAPNPRDEYGNVITVRRRLIELYDVSISGLTVKAGNVPVEAGISMIDVNTGTISSVKVEGIVPGTGPGSGAFEPPAALAAHGQGIIVANTIEETSNVTTITGSQISGFNSTGILVDNRGLGGTGSVGNNSFVTAKITNTRITAATSSPVIGQTGIEAWGSGARLQLTKSKISKAGKADGSAAAIALHGIDLANSFVGGSEANRVDFNDNLYGITNVAYDGSAALSSLNATSNYWGTTVDTGVPLVGPQVNYEPLALSAPAATTLAPIADNLPSGQWDTGPADGSVVATGSSLPLAIIAADDFGVKQVEFKINGASLGVSPTPVLLGERVYTGSWTPSASAAGPGNLLTAVVTDSAGQTTTLTRSLTIEGKPHFTLAPAISGTTEGYAAVGKPLTCSSGTAAAYPAATYSYSWTVAGVAAGTASSTYTPVAADQGKNIACSVKATNSFGSASAGGGPVLVASVPVLASPAELSGASGTYALVGDELTCSAGAASGNPVPTVSYSWTKGGSPIAGTTTHTVDASDVGGLLACSVKAESAGGSVSSTASVTAGAPPAFTAAAAVLGGLSSGYALQGTPVSCSSGTPSGYPVPSVTYAWTVAGSPVGANSSTYTPVAADAGKALGCKVTVANAISTINETGTTAEVATAPAFSSAAALSGASGLLAKAGDALQCAAAGNGDPAPALTFSWLREGATIAGQATADYTVVAADEGHEISCVAHLQSIAGSAGSTATVGVGSLPKEGAPVLTGDGKIGSVLSCSSGTWTAIPKATFSYSWLRNGVAIEAQAGDTYVTTLADVGSGISCKVTAANSLGTGEAMSSPITVLAAPPAIADLSVAKTKLKGAKVAVGMVSCDVGPCVLSGPKTTAIKIGGKKYGAKVIIPAVLAGGESGVVKIKLSKAARKALKKAGKSGKFKFTIGVEGGGGTASTVITIQLKK